MNTKLAILCLAGVMSTACVMRASTVTVNLGQSSQDFEQIGLGPDSNNYVNWTIVQGACSPSGGNTSCVLSGTYTGSTAGFTSGSYSLITDYPGSGGSPLIGVSQNPIPDAFAFYFAFLGAGTTIDLDLHDISGVSYDIPIYVNGNFTNSSYGVYYSGTTSCTGVDPANCDTQDVGETLGATIQGEVSGSAQFDVADAVVTPEPTGLALLGLLPGAVYAFRSRLVGIRGGQNQAG